MDRIAEPERMDLPEEAEAYAAADFAEVNQAFARRLIELAGDLPQALAIDLGSGPADIPIRVIHLRPAWRVLALDAAEAMLRIARARLIQEGLTESVRPLLCDAKQLPLRDRCADLVMSNSILHHVTDAAAFWNEIRRTIRPGGRILVRDLRRPPTPRDAQRLVDQHAGGESQLLREEFFRSLLSAYAPEEVTRQLQAAKLGMLMIEVISDRHLDVHGTVDV